MTNNRNGNTLDLGSVVEKLFDEANAVANDGVSAADLAARSLERVLTRGVNARLAAALSDLAFELTPVHAGRKPAGRAVVGNRAAPF